MSRGLRPQLQQLDNKASQALVHYLEEENMHFQLSPSSVYYINATERAIRTLKNHFIAIMCDIDPNFNITLWRKLIPQDFITLNLIRKSNIKSNISTYPQLYSAYNFNHIPIAPLEMRVMVYEKPDDRETWSPLTVKGWYIGPVMYHYICYKVWIKAARAKRITDTIAWFSSNLVMTIQHLRE